MALFWWIDRWRRSSAFMDMTLAEQGAYRNLLDEAHLRGGALPMDERILAKACGDAMAWPKVREAVMARFEKRADGWHNFTLDEVMRESERRAEKQRNYRDRGNTNGNGGGNAQHNKPRNTDGSPSPSPSPSLISVSGTGTRSTPSAPSALDRGFEEFWHAYPKKVGKAAALKVWNRLKPVNGQRERILSAVDQQAATDQWTREHGRFIPNPATWLNQGRWDDEPIGAPIPPSDDSEPYDWFQECKRIHNGECQLDRYKHALRLRTDQLKAHA